jgi:NADPH:quinone reductase-like Zn-dependent oxidoreductase
MAKVVRFDHVGGPEVLKLVDTEVRSPGPGELKINVHSIGLNRAETMFRMGQYLENPRLPAGLGYEASGIVSAIGPNVTGFEVGDVVSVIPGFSMNDYACYGSEAVVPAASTVKHPASLSFEEAAAVWMQYMTAYGALVAIGQVKQGDAVIITAASSSVGLAAIQIVNAAGGVSIATTRKPEKKQAMLKHGAQHVIATETEDLVAEVARITNKQGARLVFDPVGGPTIEKLAKATAYEGTIFQYGALSPEPTPYPLFTALSMGLTIRGYTLMELKVGSARFEAGKKYVLDGLTKGTLKPVIAKTFPLSQIVEAHRYLEGNQQVGKIVVNVD